ncbi:unnamed protein product [Caenorhabditis auriculariae]|uniref:Uncharacterized protein n=1 Tax=Caenorhabditis auriculariae TaxID=2777116 RepID=A0A8S1H1V4_9PELO|nr:unnamed protein product [Caenorhabditis auriculariae]
MSRAQRRSWLRVCRCRALVRFLERKLQVELSELERFTNSLMEVREAREAVRFRVRALRQAEAEVQVRRCSVSRARRDLEQAKSAYYSARCDDLQLYAALQELGGGAP